MTISATVIRRIEPILPPEGRRFSVMIAFIISPCRAMTGSRGHQEHPSADRREKTETLHILSSWLEHACRFEPEFLLMNRDWQI